ncbi:MAG: hypothetical protein WCR51_10385 [Planctomycetia bacterium]
MVRPAAGRVALSLLVLLGTSSRAADACPFCGIVGESLAMRRDAADVVAIGEANDGVTPGPDGFPEQAFTLGQTLRGTIPPDITEAAARVTGPVVGTAIVFGRSSNGDLRWSALAAHEAVLGYAAAAPATSLPAAERLRWFAQRLEHPDPAIAADAFAEFGLAPFDAVREAADAFDPIKLAAWVGEAGIDARRRGFYGLAAGIVAADTRDAAVRRDLLADLHDAIAAPADDFRAGYDGLLAGLIVAEGAAALDEFSRLGLFGPSARPVDQRHLLAALRFAWESLDATIPRDRVAAATARLLNSRAVAADAAVDLARFQAWEPLDTVANLWMTLGRDDPLVRRAVAGYLDACPLPAARTHLDRLRTADAERLDAALEAARAPLARP